LKDVLEVSYTEAKQLPTLNKSHNHFWMIFFPIPSFGITCTYHFSGHVFCALSSFWRRFCDWN
jgi:hypothetical protein